MRLFDRLFKSQSVSGIRSGVGQAGEADNAATHITVDQLIRLQQQARRQLFGKQPYARTSTIGSHHSRFRGRGMDYQESRIYQAGDDIRNMDWRVAARTGKPHTKLYQEERERPIVLLVDFSPSMFFGTQTALKSVIAAKVATMIAWAAAAKGDRVGGLLINDSHCELPPKMGKRGVLQLIRELVKYADPATGLQTVEKADKPNNFNAELKRLRQIARPGSMVFLISDFYHIDAETERHLQRLSQHVDIQAIHIVDPIELTPPPPAQYRVTDGDAVAVLDTRSESQQQQYEAFFAQQHEACFKMMRRHKIPLAQIQTSDDILKTLQQHFSLAGGA